MENEKHIWPIVKADPEAHKITTYWAPHPDQEDPDPEWTRWKWNIRAWLSRALCPELYDYALHEDVPATLQAIRQAIIGECADAEAPNLGIVLDAFAQSLK